LLSAEDLLEKFDKGGSITVGGTKFTPFGWGIFPGEGTDFINKYNTLIAQLALDNVKYLKGQGQVSDAERKILNDASTSLKRNSSDTEFRKNLVDIINSFKTVGQKNLQERNQTDNRNSEIPGLGNTLQQFTSTSGNTYNMPY
jgi:hypothetical protein